jgi:hypothetical protein
MFFRALSKTRRIKSFSYTPRYYDEEKEKMKQRYQQAEAALNGGSAYSSGPINLKEKWHRNKRTSHFEKKSNVRLVFIITILFALCYWILYV